jgi:hypothetical protein
MRRILEEEWLQDEFHGELALSEVNSDATSPCPTHPALAKSCLRVRRVSLGVFVISLTIYATGFYFVFLAGWQE